MTSVHSQDSLKPSSPPDDRPERVPRPRGEGLHGSHLGQNMASTALAEGIGTFILVLAITATAVPAALGRPIAGGAFDSLAVVLANGLTLAALVTALGQISGGHFNPAVTIGLAVTRKFPFTYVVPYLVAQLLGGILAALVTWSLYGTPGREKASLGATQIGPGVGVGTGLLVETLGTFVLVFVVIAVATDDRVPVGPRSIAIGFALAAAVLIAGPLTGAGLNPARALGPMIVAGKLDHWWLFLLAPLVGGVLAALLYDRVIRRASAPA